MKKYHLVRNIFVLVVFTCLVLGFAGCLSITPPAPTTGTVYITIGGIWSNSTHNIYMDGVFMGTTSNGSFTINNVSPGSHTFAVGQNIIGSYYDSKTVNINVGANYVTLIPMLIIGML